MEDATLSDLVYDKTQAANIFLKNETDVFYNDVYIIVIIIIIIIIIMCFSIFSTRTCLSKYCQIIGRSLYCLKLPCRAFPAAAFVVAMASDLVGKAAPDFEIELEDGSKKKLSEFLAEGHRGHLRTTKIKKQKLHISG